MKTARSRVTVIHVAATLPRLEGSSVSLMALSTTAANVPFAAPLRGVVGALSL